eukprot:5410075-Prymnesium_polylepis.1
MRSVVQSHEPPSSSAAMSCPVSRDVGGCAWGASAAAPACWRVTRVTPMGSAALTYVFTRRGQAQTGFDEP